MSNDYRYQYEAERQREKIAAHWENIVISIVIGLPVLIIVSAVAFWIVRHGMAVG